LLSDGLAANAPNTVYDLWCKLVLRVYIYLSGIGGGNKIIS